MKVFDFTTETLQETFDKVKDLILINMVNEGIITKTQSEEYSNTHTIILKNPSTISRYFKKIFKTDNDSRMMVVRITDFPIRDDDYFPNCDDD
jgi:predicted transcriptional regulator